MIWSFILLLHPITNIYPDSLRAPYSALLLLTYVGVRFNLILLIFLSKFNHNHHGRIVFTTPTYIIWDPFSWSISDSAIVINMRVMKRYHPVRRVLTNQISRLFDPTYNQ